MWRGLYVDLQIISVERHLKGWYLDHIVDLGHVTVGAAALVQSPQKDRDAVPSRLLVPLQKQRLWDLGKATMTADYNDFGFKVNMEMHGNINRNRIE